MDTTDHAPLILAHTHKNAMRIAAMDERAMALGLRIDQGLADAKAQFPSLDIVAHMPDADHALLEAIADWCDRYTPLVARDNAHGLFLDITGCAHLFGGEHAMARDMMEKLFHQGFATRIAIADTAGAAHAAAWHNADTAPVHVPSKGEFQALRNLGLRALRLPPEMVSALERTGLKTIAALANVPRAALARRFGREPLLRLDQALGACDEVLSPRMPVADITADRHLASPISDSETIRQIVFKLASTLKDDLEKRVRGGQQFELVLFRVDGVVRRLRVGTANPLRDPERITGLFSERLSALGDDLDIGCGFDLIRLSVPLHAPLDAGQGDFSRRDKQRRHLDQLLDRIAARLGNETCGGVHPVHRVIAVESHMPERAEMRIPAICEPVSSTPQTTPFMLRPIRFLEPPEPVEVMAEIPDGAPVRFKWRRVTCHVARAEGPERIAGEWWNDEDITDETHTPQARDYYRIEDHDGRRYWLFRAGLYDRVTGQHAVPRWFMQGLFA